MINLAVLTEKPVQKIARGFKGGTQVVKRVILVREAGRRVGRVKSPAYSIVLSDPGTPRFALSNPTSC